MTPIQEEYKNLVQQGAVFQVKGHSLIYQGRTYPVAMAKHIGVRPKTDDWEQLNRVWEERY